MRPDGRERGRIRGFPRLQTTQSPSQCPQKPTGARCSTLSGAGGLTGGVHYGVGHVPRIENGDTATASRCVGIVPSPVGQADAAVHENSPRVRGPLPILEVARPLGRHDGQRFPKVGPRERAVNLSAVACDTQEPAWYSVGEVQTGCCLEGLASVALDAGPDDVDVDHAFQSVGQNGECQPRLASKREWVDSTACKADSLSGRSSLMRSEEKVAAYADQVPGQNDDSTEQQRQGANPSKHEPG